MIWSYELGILIPKHWTYYLVHPLLEWLQLFDQLLIALVGTILKSQGSNHSYSHLLEQRKNILELLRLNPGPLALQMTTALISRPLLLNQSL